MNINSIDYKNSFQGKFLKTNALDKAMENASDYDLKKFGKILRRMKNVDENKTYQIHSYVETNGWNKGYESVRLRETQTYDPPKDKVFLSYSDKDLNYGKPENAYKGVLKKVNDFLEKIYPEPEVTKANREKSINYINSFLA